MLVKESELRAIITKILSEIFDGSSYRFTGTPTSALFGDSGIDSDDVVEIDNKNYISEVPSGAKHVYPVPKGIRIGSPPQPARSLPGEGPRKHRGYDFPCAIGTPIMAVADGEIVFAGDVKGYGINIVISHSQNLVGKLSFTAYNHLNNIIKSKGKVAAGDIIGLSGNTGKSTGPHLHFSMGETSKKSEMSFEKSLYDDFLSSCRYTDIREIEKDDSVADSPAIPGAEEITRPSDLT